MKSVTILCALFACGLAATITRDADRMDEGKAIMNIFCYFFKISKVKRRS